MRGKEHSSVPQKNKSKSKYKYKIKAKKNLCRLPNKGFLYKILALTYFYMATATLSSAQVGFTSEFGMDSGGSQQLWTPGRAIVE